MSKLVLILGLACCLLQLPSYAAVPNVFSNGTIADATLVNQNFNYFENKFSTTSGHDHNGVNSKTVASVIITSAYGGTGNNNSTAPQGSILYAQATGDFVALSPGTSGQGLISGGTFANPSWGTVSTAVVQTVNNIGDSTFGPSANLAFGAVATGTTVIPNDDTIPQNTEGDQYMQLTITPKSATSKLKIDVTVVGSLSIGDNHSLALFQDATASALTVASVQNVAGVLETVSFSYYMTSGTTSATTFKVRVGKEGGASTYTFNGVGGARKFGGISGSMMTITELKS